MNSIAQPFLSLVWQRPVLRRGVITCVGLSFVASAAEISVALSLVPILASLGIDAGAELSSFVESLPATAWLLLFAFAAALRSITNWLSSVQDERKTQEIVVSLQSRLYRALATAHWDSVRRLAPPTITSALHSQTYEAGYGFNYLVQLIAALLLVLGYLVSTAFVFPIMLPVLLLILALMWQINVRRNKQVHEISEDYVDAHKELHQRYEDWVAVSRIASLGVDTAKLADRFESRARDAASHSVGYSRSSAATQMSYEAAVVAGIVLGVPIAWWLEAPPAILTFGLVAFVRVMPRAGSIQSAYQGIVNAVAPYKAVDELASQLELDPVNPPSNLEPLKWQQLELVDVVVEDTVRDDEEHWILRNISLYLQQGAWMALAGPTGAGKTTLADVMLMLVRPNSGEIRVDGQAVQDDLADRWRNQAAYVPQDVVLFDATIRDNLRLYVPDATDDELEVALKQSAAEFVLTSLPEGLDTRAGPSGRWLSGGERQRIGIARALLRKPGFLVLDEPTAALDTDTQEKLMSALGKLEHTMSVVLITHRPELLRLADRVVNIEDGEIRG